MAGGGEPFPKAYTGAERSLGMGSLGWPEILLIVAVVLLLFGAKRLPEMARSLGRSSREFKKGLSEGAADDKQSEPQEASPKPTESSDTKTE
jgi:sec-independent protein translocase protein TatA